jgi:hypothetical protein
MSNTATRPVHPAKFLADSVPEAALSSRLTQFPADYERQAESRHEQVQADSGSESPSPSELAELVDRIGRNASRLRCKMLSG